MASLRFASALKATFFCLVAVIVGGCSSSDDPNSNNNNGATGFTIVINGGGMSNRSIAFGTPGTSTPGTSVSAFSTSNNATGVTVSGGTYKIDGQDVTAVITFPGKTSGSFTYPANNVAVGLVIGSGVGGENFTSGNSSGTILVSEYGSVGGKVRGTFSGSMMYIKGISAPVSVNVSGTFEGVRLADGQ